MQIHCSNSYNAKYARRLRNYKFWPLSYVRGDGKNCCKHTVIRFMFANKRNNSWSTCCDREFNNGIVRLLQKQWHFRQKDGLLLQSRLKPLLLIWFLGILFFCLLDLSLSVKKVINLLFSNPVTFSFTNTVLTLRFFLCKLVRIFSLFAFGLCGTTVFFLNSKFGIEFCRKKCYINARKLSDVILYWNITKIIISYRIWEKMVAYINFVIQLHPAYNIPFFLIFDEASNSLTIINIFTTINYHTVQC